MYVLNIDPKKNEIIVGERENLGKKIIQLNKMNLLVDENEFQSEIFVKVRSTGKLLKAKIFIKKDSKAEVKLNISEDGISPGQACVFYKR